MEYTLEALLKKGTVLLAESGNEEAGLDAWLLLEYTTKKTKAYYFAHPGEMVDEETAKAYLELIGRRREHIPLQHLTHQAYFMGYPFYVDANVLIPRADTECVVEKAMKLLEGYEKPRLLDMCTGSGCILASLLLERPGSTGVGADISEDALKVAEKNARELGVDQRMELVCSDLFSGAFFEKMKGKAEQKFDMLISNPPYIAAGEIKTLQEEVRLHDPRRALEGGEDGLFFYRRITEAAPEFLKPGGTLIYEIGYDQGEVVSQMLRQAGFQNVEVRRDYGGLDRMVYGQIRENQEEKHV